MQSSFHGRSIQRGRQQRGRFVEELEQRLVLTTLTPAQVAHAYSVDQIAFGSVAGTGAGQTIAIVDAYDAPEINSDLATFDAKYNLPNTDGTGAPVLTEAMPQGTPVFNSNWAGEITLDVEWAHAIAPGAHILLVEATDSSSNSLISAVNYASSQPGVSVVSMSWGSGEFSSEAASDSTFTTPSGHSNVSYIASAGDVGAAPEWPSVSSNVMAVGGTQLTIADTSGTYGSETAWSSSGGGTSQFEVQPPFQSGVNPSGTKRTAPDVAWDASGASGVYVYYSGNGSASGSWYSDAGTSVGAPSWAGVIAIADQGRALEGAQPLDGASELLPALYHLSSNDFHDIVTGTAASGKLSNQAGPGYDLVTGLGSPYANLVAAGLANWGVSNQLAFQQEPTSTTAGVAISNSLSVLVEDPYDNVETSDSSTVTLTLSSGTFANGSTTVTAQAVNGVATFNNLVIDSAGNYTLIATDATVAATTSHTFTVSPAAPTQVVFLTSSNSGAAGAAVNPAVKVAVEDQFGNIVSSSSTVTLTLNTGKFATNLSTVSASTVGGIATFSNLIIDLAGAYSLSATDGSLTAASTALTIRPTTSSKLVFLQPPPASGTAGQALTPAPIVAVEDAFGNIVTGDNSTVTLTLSGGTFSNGATTVTTQVVNGLATFSNVVINQIGAAYRLTASDGSLIQIGSGYLKINPATAAQLSLQSNPTTATAGTVLTPIQVNVEDAYGNLVSTSSTVTLTLSSGVFSTGLTAATAVTSAGIAKPYGLILRTAGSYTLVVTDSLLPASTSQSFSVNIIPAAASKLSFTQLPGSSAVAGSVASDSTSSIAVVQVQDAYGNLVVGDASMVTLTAGTTQFTSSAVNGVATFVVTKAGYLGLTATDGSLTRAVSAALTINPSTTMQIIPSSPTSGTAGTALAVKVTLEDVYGNVVTTDSGSSVNIAVSGPGLLTVGTSTASSVSATAVKGVATFSLILKTAGSYVLTSSIPLNGSVSAVQTPVTINSAAAYKLIFSPMPNVGTAGVPLTASGGIVACVEDPFNNVVSGFNSSVTISVATGPGNFTPTSDPNPSTVTVTALNGVATFTNLTLNTAGVYTFSANAINPTTGLALPKATSVAVTISPSTTSQLVVTSLSSGSAGTALAVKVTLEDAYGNTVTTDNASSVNIAVNGPGLLTVGTSTASSINATAVKGIATFTLILKTAGSYVLSSSIPLNGAVPVVQTPVTINSAAAYKLVFSQVPTAGTAGIPLTGTTAMIACVEDAFSNVVSGFNSNVTVSVATGPGSFTPAGDPNPSTLTVAAVNGIATFSSLTLNTAGAYLFSANAINPVTNLALAKATSIAVTINPSTTSQLIVTVPSSGSAGTAVAVKVTLKDAYGNTVTTDSSSVIAITESGPGFFTVGTTTPNSVSATAVKGVATFSLILKTAGNYSLTSNLPLNGTVPSVQSALTINPIAAYKLFFQQAPPISAVAGIAFASDVVVAVEDAYSNVVTSDSSSVTLTIGNGIFTTNAVAGIATFPGLNSLSTSTLFSTKAGTFTPTATDGLLVRATSPNLAVSAGSARQVVLVNVPATGNVGVAIGAISLAVEDAFGNIVTTDNSTVTLTIATGPSASFKSGATVTVLMNRGVATISTIAFTTAGTYTIQAADGSLTPAISNGIQIS